MNHVKLDQIENIIFDLGNVILNIDLDLTNKAFAQLGIPDFNFAYNFLKQDNTFVQLEKGLIDPSEFRQKINNKFKLDLQQIEFDEAWNKLLLDIPLERINLLRKLMNEFDTYILSNTNIIHVRHFHSYLEHEYQIPDLSSLFKKVYYSFELGMRKPDKEIYQYVLEDNNIAPEKTLFLDDLAKNLEPAAELGIQTIQITPEIDILTVFKKFL